MTVAEFKNGGPVSEWKKLEIIPCSFASTGHLTISLKVDDKVQVVSLTVREWDALVVRVDQLT